MAHHPAYGRRHQQVRERLMKRLPYPCGICGQIMTRDMKLHLHHSRPGAKERGEPGDTLAHASCNDSFGQPGRPRKTRPAPDAFACACTGECPYVVRRGTAAGMVMGSETPPRQQWPGLTVTQCKHTARWHWGRVW